MAIVKCFIYSFKVVICHLLNPKNKRNKLKINNSDTNVGGSINV